MKIFAALALLFANVAFAAGGVEIDDLPGTKRVGWPDGTGWSYVSGALVGTAKAGSGGPAYIFGTTTNHTSGNFLEVYDATNQLIWAIDYSGSLATGTIPAARISGAVSSASTATALAADPTGCTNQYVTDIAAAGTLTCTTDTLASAYHANQGTTTTVLHGNAAGNPSWAAVTPSDLGSVGTGVATALGVNVGSAGAFVTNGGALGTPSSGTLTNATGLPTSGITGYGTGLGEATATGLVITDASAAGLEVGPNGANNPVFRVVDNVASQADGISITGLAAGNGTNITALSSGSNSSIKLVPKGTGNVVVSSNGSETSPFIAGSAGRGLYEGVGGLILTDGTSANLLSKTTLTLIPGANVFGWNSGGSVQSVQGPDTGFSRSAAAIVEVNNGTAGTLGQFRTGGLQGNNTVKALTESSATTFVKITMSSGSTASGDLIYAIEANDASDRQVRSGRIPWTAVDKAGTITCTVGTVGAATEVAAVSTGTLTNTFTCADAGSNVLDLKANAVSSLTQTTLQIRYRVEELGTNTVTAQ